MIVILNNKPKLNILLTKHTYLKEKLIVDLVNGIGVVAKDLNNSAKSKEKGIIRLWDSIAGNAKKRQNQINENFIEGLKSASKWLQDHDRHLTRVDYRLKELADELYNTQDEILKFYKEFKDVDLRVELLEDFKKSAEEKFENLESRIRKLEAQQEIDREISKIGHLELPSEIEIFTIIDNLASGEFGLWFMFEKDSRKKYELLEYLQRKIVEKTQINKDKLIDYVDISNQTYKLPQIERQAIKFISKQYEVLDDKEYEIIDLISILAKYKDNEALKVINDKSHIRTFITYEQYINTLTHELIGNIDE